jgi:DNA repair exonuclease SbcCD ATPase subunit
MHIVEIVLHNWGCFRGEHVLKLEPIAYSVVGMREDDSEASNWTGKSILLEAVRFALYGVHRHRFEEGWISKGEKEGGVKIAMSTGLCIRRERRPGKGTQVSCFEGEKVFKGDEAQKKIDALIGLGEEDFGTTSYFAQGETAGMVRADPAVRTATVARWLKLEPLERCVADVRKQGDTANRQLDGIRAEIASWKKRTEEAVLSSGVKREEMQEAFEVADARVLDWNDLIARASEEEANARLREERSKILEEGKALLALHRAEDGEVLAADLQKAADAKEKASIVQAEAKARAATRRSVARGTFDGRCPVAGIECPATDVINHLGAAADVQASAAQLAFEEARKAYMFADEVWREANEAMLTRRARAERLRTLQERVKSLVPAEGLSVSSGVALGAARRERDAAAGRAMSLKRAIDEVGCAAEKIEALEVGGKEHAVQATACREASLIFVAAKRRLAEGVLGEVARRANAMLRDAGVELSLEMSWEREGKGLADDCLGCGSAFPVSARAKVCGHCGAARGAKRIQRLDVELSARSGAAEDLAGLALSLSAGAWLRGERGSPWSATFLDEPGAQLDRRHRRAMSQHLPRILAAASIEQSFVISHSPDSVASLPGRIEVRRAGDWSTVSVG